MGKNKDGFNPKRQKTINERRKLLRSSTISTMVFLVIMITYIMMNYVAYADLHPRDGIGEKLREVIPLISKNPFYFLENLDGVVKNLGLIFGMNLIVVMFEFMSYTFQKLKIHDDINTLKGSAKWGDVLEVVKRYADFSSNKKNYKNVFTNIPLGKNLYVSTNVKKHYHALNTLVIGETGGGKSRYVLKPNLLQMNCNFVVTDPKKAIVQECGEALRRFGYNVYLIDLITMENCDHYNPLKYCRKESDIKKVVRAFIDNTNLDANGSGSKDPFWDDSMNAFLCACIALLTTIPEGSDVPYAQIPEITGGLLYKPCFKNLTEFTRMANKKYDPVSSGIELYEGVKLGDGKNNTANASCLAAIFENLRMWEADRQGLDPEEMIKPYALREWENFRIAPEKTSTTILMTTAVRMDAFNIEQVADLTNDDTINLDDFLNKKSVIFVATPTTDKTYNFIVSFLYTQLFDILYTAGSSSAGTKAVFTSAGEFIKNFGKVEAAAGEAEQFQNDCKLATIVEHAGSVYKGKKEVKDKTGKKKMVPVTINDSYYDICLPNGEVISRRPTKALAEAYLKTLQNTKIKVGNGNALPCHTRFLLDEFVNTCKIPEFLEKLATMRGYEISATVIVQSITQLKLDYEKNYETFDANCPFVIFLGGDEVSNNEYISKKLGKATVRGASNSVDNKKVSGSYNEDSRELMSADELGRMEQKDEVIIISHENPLIDEKYDYPSHPNYKYTWDYASEIHCGKAYRFDTSTFSNREKISTTIRTESLTCVPEVKEFDMEACKRILKAASFTECEENLEKNMEKHFSFDVLSDDDEDDDENVSEDTGNMVSSSLFEDSSTAEAW